VAAVERERVSVGEMRNVERVGAGGAQKEQVRVGKRRGRSSRHAGTLGLVAVRREGGADRTGLLSRDIGVSAREWATTLTDGARGTERERVEHVREGNRRQQVGPTGQRERGSRDTRARARRRQAGPGCQGGAGARELGLAGPTGLKWLFLLLLLLNF
jgi:hypothetical protein